MNGSKNMKNREKLRSRLGFILLSAGCAIGVGNIWKFPMLCGENGGAAFVFFYIIFLIILGLPLMTIEFALGRGSQESPMTMLDTLAPGKKVWPISGWFSLAGNVLLLMFYTTIAGWFIDYFIGMISGRYISTGQNVLTDSEVEAVFDSVSGNPWETLLFMAVVCIIAAVVCSFSLQGGLERVTKWMMVLLFAILIAMAVNSCVSGDPEEGLRFYLVPDFSKVTAETVVNAMNQAFFTLSLGVGSMAIFGSYIGKERSLMGETVRVIVLDTVVALLAGVIIFPACFQYGIDPAEGPGLIFKTLPVVFNNMKGGQLWGVLLFLLMSFAALSTVLAVMENIVSMVRESFGWSRIKGSVICSIGLMILSVPCSLGFNVWSGFEPFAAGTNIRDLEDFLVSNIILPIGCLTFTIFCTRKIGWGWDNFVAEANAGNGMKVKKWMKPYMSYVLPVIILVVGVVGLITFDWK